MQNSAILQIYFKEINKYPLLTKGEEDDLILRAQFGETSAKDLLVMSNLRFVVTIARKLIVPQIELEDLIQEGNVGLIKSIEKFDPSRKVKFLSYAVWWIKQGMYSFINENSRTIRLALNQIRSNSAYKKKQDELIATTSDEYATPDDLGYLEHTHISLDELHGEMSIIEIIPNPNNEDPDRYLIAESLKKELDIMLGTLSEREVKILKLYYGIGFERAYTLDEVGDKMKLTRERVRQIKEITLNRLSLKPRFQALLRYL